MNLRQIVRNQKLSNFDYRLSDFISEADDEEVKKKDAFAGKTKAGSSKYWYVNKQGQMKAVVNPPAEGGWELADKDQAEEAEEREKDIEVDVDDEVRDNINQEMEAQGLKPHPEDENSFVDGDGDEIFQIGPDGDVTPGGDVDKFRSAEGEPYADYIEDLNDRLAGDEDKGKEPEKKSEPKKKKPSEERVTVKAELNPPTDPKSEQEILEFRMSIFNKEKQSGAWTGRNKQSTPAGNPPSDAMARQTGLDTGFPKKGTKPWPRSKVTGQDAAPAPGNPGSMMNEIFSVEGCNAAEAFYERFDSTPTVEDMESVLQQQFGNTQLAKDNGGPNGAEYRKKLRIAAQASITKFDRLKNSEANNAQTDPSFGKMIRPPSEFYGAADSIEAQAKMIRDLPEGATIFGPDGPITEIQVNERTKEELIGAMTAAAKKGAEGYGGEPFVTKRTKSKVDVDEGQIEAAVEEMLNNNTDPESVKKFVELLALAGGGGANPSDTATFAQSEDGNLMVLFHSDKMSTEDQQANSTLGQEAKRQELYLNELIAGGQLDEKEEAYAKRELEKFVDVFNETSAADDSVDMAPAILELMDDPEKKAALIDAFHGSAKSNRPMIVPREGESREDYLDRKNAFEISPDDPQAREEQVEEFLQYFNKPLGDPPEGRPPATGDQGRFFQKLKENLAKDKKSDLFSEEEIESIDSTTIGSERTKKVVGAIQDRLAALDKIKTKDGIPVGQYIETKNIIDKLHLYAMDDPSSLAYQSGMCATVIGNDVVNRDVLRSVFGIESSEDLIGKVKVGAAAAPKDDWVDDSVGGGVPNSLIQRSTDSFVKEGGKPLYFTVNEEGKITGTTTDESEAQRTKSGKPVKVGVPTGQKSLFYAVDAHGEDCMFASQAARSKEGPGKPMQTAYTFGGCMREGIKKYGKESMKEESVYHKLYNILSEVQENTLAYHWKKAEDDYPLHYFIRELNESSLK